MCTLSVSKLPDWVPEDALRYLEHTESGQSIRQLARRAGCHPSTVLRQVRRIENRRDDPLVDGALSELARWNVKTGAGSNGGAARAVELETHSAEVLTRLGQPGAVLAVAEGMENAVVLREGDPVEAKLPVPRALAGAMALLGWISCTRPGRLSRYQITQNGRNALTRIVAQNENKARTRAEHAEGRQARSGPAPTPGLRRQRYSGAETPLDMLARLMDKNGDPFLPPDLVLTGKRLREDYEVAQVGQHLAQGAAYFGADDCSTGDNRGWSSQSAREAQNRAMGALTALGPGLSDIALRCCCYLEGLEAAERQLGWSARSGKIVLRIALQQLQSYYQAQDGETGGGHRRIG